MYQTIYLPTYHLRRQCVHCSTPIADQIHKKTIFCEREVLEDGSIKCCSDDYHSELRRVEMKPLNQLALFHRDTTRAISELLIEKGELVTKEDLNHRGIQLPKRIYREENQEGLSTFFFNKYALKQTPSNYFKIISHDLL